MPTATRHSSEGDVHLRIWLGGALFDYRVTATAARNLIDEWARRRWYSVELVRTPARDLELLPRMPCERLFNGP